MDLSPQGTPETLKSTSVGASQVESASHCCRSRSIERMCRRLAAHAMVAISRTRAVVTGANRSHEKEIFPVAAVDGTVRMTAPKDGARCEFSARSSLNSCFIFFSVFSVFIEMFRVLEPGAKVAFAAFVMGAR